MAYRQHTNCYSVTIDHEIHDEQSKQTILF